MSAVKELKATVRMRAGKGAARAERRLGRVPGVIYGGKEPPQTIALDYREINQKIYAGHFLSTIFELDLDGTKIRVIPRDYQLDVVKDTPLHVDFLRITAGSTIRVDVPVHLKNQDQSPGLKVGGVVNLIYHSIEVLCPADRIPDEFVIDLTGKEIGDTVHIADMVLPEGVRPTDRSNFTVASIAPPTKAEVAPTAAAAETEGGEETAES
jgi:large subunit ribosomal protein L25